MNERHHSGNGFLFGIIVGVLLTLLFTTKKGRNILKTLADEGVDSISDLLDPEMEDEIVDETFVSEKADFDEIETDEKKQPHNKRSIFKGLRKN